MSAIPSRRVVVALAVVALCCPGRAAAQFAETPRVVPVSNGRVVSAAQIGQRLFLAGSFTQVSDPTGGAVIVDATGALLPGAFPRFAGLVTQVVADGLGGWLVAGDFTSAGDQPFARFARVAPDRTIDVRYHLDADGPIRLMALAHGRIYLLGDFTHINGVPRRGLAVLDAASGQLSPLGTGFDPEGRRMAAISTSSIGVYVSAWSGPGSPGRIWGFDAGTGAQFFTRSLTVGAIAATSTRVYLGGEGYQRPVWAIDPITGQDLPWRTSLPFQPIYTTYGDSTMVSALLLDGDRLYLGGRFRTPDQYGLAAVEAATGQATTWRPAQTGIPTGLVRIGPAVVAMTGAAGTVPSVRSVHAFDVVTGALLPFDPRTYGDVRTLALANEGVVIGGGFDGIGGPARNGLASFDLDTLAIDPWTVSVAVGTIIEQVATDGTWLFARTRDATFLKIDPASGAIVGEHRVSTGDVVLGQMRVASGVLVTGVTTRFESTEIGVLSVADWSYQALPVVFDGGGRYVASLDVLGDTIYLAGPFDGVNGVSRPFAAAVSLATGEVLPWRPSPDAEIAHVRAAAGRVWVSGNFLRIGGARRRGLAELDATTAAATTWNPDVPVGYGGTPIIHFAGAIELGPDGLLYAVIDSSVRPTVSGQRTPHTVAFSPATGQRVTWRPTTDGWVAIMPGCLLTTAGCLPPAVTPPTDLRVEQAGGAIALRWTLPLGAPDRTGIRLEVGRAEGAADLLVTDLSATQTSYTAMAPAGSYFARVRSRAGAAISWATEDVSFAVGAPAAPLDVRATTEGTQVTLAWTPPSTGAPPAYRFEAGSQEGGRDLAALSLAGGSSSVTIEAPAGIYWGRLIAVSGAGQSAPSGELYMNVDATRPFCRGLVPNPPTDLAAVVVGQTVTMAWQQPADGVLPTYQRVMAGTAPGLDNLGALGVTASATSFTTTAPPGVYYVRVIAVNDCGASLPSNEVMVTVP